MPICMPQKIQLSEHTRIRINETAMVSTLPKETEEVTVQLIEMCKMTRKN